MCDLTNTIIKPPLLSVISGIYGMIILLCELVIGKIICLILFLLYKKYQYFHLQLYLNRQPYGVDIKIRKDKVINLGMS